MSTKHVNNTSYNSPRSFLNEQWLKHSKIFKKEISQMDKLVNWQDYRKQNYIQKHCICNVARNVSSIELENLLDSNNPAICSKKTYKYKDTDDCLQPCPHILQYSRIVMQTCQNKGCMCKPVIQGRPKCQISDEVQIHVESEVNSAVVTKNAKIQTPKPNNDEIPQHRKSIISHSDISETRTSSPSEISEQIKSNISQNEISDYIQKGGLQSKTRQSQTIDVIEQQPAKRGSIKPKNGETKRGSIKYEMCKKNPCDPCPDQTRYCVPSNFEQLLEEPVDRETTFMQCKNRDLCTCDTYDTTESLKKGIKLPGKYICIQSPPEPEIQEGEKEEEEEEKPSKEEMDLPKKKEEMDPPKEETPVKKTSSSTTCCCFKKKTAKKDSEKCIQTCKCCSDKCCQYEEGFTIYVDNKGPPCHPSEPACEKVKNIWICSKCGKIYNTSNTCRNRPSCMRNTVVVPQLSGPAFSNDQDALITMIKLEAKQNFRLIDNILQELRQQRTEIKKLSDRYQEIVGTKSRNSVINPEDFENSGLQNTQIYICEGCELDVNRNILRTTKGDMIQHFDNNEREWETGYQITKNNKYIKNIINKKKCSPIGPEKEIQTKNLAGIEIGDTKYTLPIRHDLKGKRQKNKSSSYEVKNQIKHDDKIHKKIQSEKLDHLMKDEIETEKSYVEPFCKTNSEKRPHECSFVNWWKKSLTNLKQNRSKDILKRKYKSLQKKISGCKRSLTDSNKARSEDKLKCNHCIQNRISLTNIKKTQNKDAVTCKCEWLQQKNILLKNK